MLKSKQNTEHYFWGADCDSWILNSSKNLSVKQEKMPPSTKEQLHYHENSEQFFFVLKGKATFYINEQKILASQHEGICVLPKSKHFIANESEENLEFLVISSPSTDHDRIVL